MSRIAHIKDKTTRLRKGHRSSGLVTGAAPPASLPVFAQYPEQSDYVASRESARASASPVHAPRPAVDWRRSLTRPVRLHMKFHLLPIIMRLLKPFHRARLYRAQAFRNRVFFRTVRQASRPA